MARYKEGEIPLEQLAVNSSDDMLVVTAVLGFLIGLIITYLGRKGKQMWMWVWGIGLIFCSAYLGLSMTLGLKLFSHF
jgi:hypothetical protein